MSEQEYPQFLFEKHDQNKFQIYEEIQNHQGFRLPNEQNQTIYLLDQDGGWCDLNGCYYNSLGEPDGWIIVSQDGKKYMKFNQNIEFITEQSNIYYSNLKFNAALSESYLQLHKNKNQEKQNLKQQVKVDSKKNQKQGKQKDIEGQIDRVDVSSEKLSDNQLKNDEQPFKNNNRDKKNDKRFKDKRKDEKNQKNNETKKYYILNIQENTLSKEELFKYLIEEQKIKQEFIIEFNENILKLVQEKDAVKLYRTNKKEQTDKVQKFIVSL